MQVSRYAAIATALVLISAISVQSVAAAVPIATSGAFLPSTLPVQSNVRTAGNVTMFDLATTSTVIGTMSGTSSSTVHCVMQSSGQATCVGRETLTGTVAGRVGTAEFSEVLHGDFLTGSLSGSFNVVGGTGELANLRGYGTFEASGGVGTYSGQVVFAP
jgi:hypothetical protein